MKRTAVFGCGHPDRGDDAAGILVARAVAARVTFDVEVHEISDPMQMAELWAGVDRAFVVDAAVTGAVPGTVRQFSFGEIRSLGRLATSSHGLGVLDAILLAEALGQMPRELTIIAIEGQDFERGAQMGPGVRSAVSQVVESLATQLSDSKR